jgi:hypothetical protein
VSCRPSRHGANSRGETTWVVSFLRPVRPFQLFGTSERAREILKKAAIQKHDPGCQSYCNPTRCARPAKCSRCGDTVTGHDGPTGPECTHHEKCVNCRGPHSSGYEDCPAAPRRVRGQIIKSTKKELMVIRRQGQRVFEQVHKLAAQHAAGQTEDTSSDEEQAPSTQPRPTSQANASTTARGSKRRTGDTATPAPNAPPSITRTGRPIKQVNLNVAHIGE